MTRLRLPSTSCTRNLEPSDIVTVSFALYFPDPTSATTCLSAGFPYRPVLLDAGTAVGKFPLARVVLKLSKLVDDEFKSETGPPPTCLIEFKRPGPAISSIAPTTP